MKKKLRGIPYPREKVKRLFRMTKIFIALMIFCFQIQANVFSQQTRVTLKLENVSIKQLFLEIEKMTDLAFVYNTQDVKGIKSVSVDFADEEVKNVLDICLKGKGVDYVFFENHVIIRKVEPIPALQETRVITGNVIDNETKLPLPGATIRIKGTTVGTAADKDGKFQFTIPPGELSLEISFIGYKTETVVVGRSDKLTIFLTPLASEVQEVIVTGMFERRAETFAGSVTTIKREELLKAGNQNLLTSLRNIEPSFLIVENLEIGSDPNQLPTIELRGTTSFPDLRGEYQSNPNLPLFILDGFEVSLTKVMDLDMNLVETLSILKDATAKAIYGSKAANGVVVIESKKLQGGKLQVAYTGNVNIEIPILDSYDLCNAAEKLEVELLRGRYNSTNVITDLDYKMKYNELLKEVESGVDTYWLSKPVRTGVGNKHAVTIEGGDGVYNYSAYLSYNNITGAMKESKRNTLAGGVTIAYRYKQLLFRNQLTITSNDAHDAPSSFQEYANMNPYWRAHDENGMVTKLVGTFDRDYFNPMWDASIGTFSKNSYIDITDNFTFEWRILDNLKLTGRLNMTKQTSQGDLFRPPSHSSFLSYTSVSINTRGSYTQTHGKSFSINSDANMTYSTLLGEKHMIFVNLGGSLSSSDRESVSFLASGYPYDKMNNILFAQTLQGKPNGSDSKERDCGIVAVFNYSYDNIYMVDFSLRTNGSSQFGQDNRWGQFWALGAGWNLHRENFLKSSDFRQLKLRASLGYTGSQNFNSYQAIPTYQFITGYTYVNSGIGATLMQMPNYDLAWQQKMDYNVGLDAVMKNLSLRVDGYISFTDNLLTDITIAPSIGFETMKENLGKVKNTGFEARASYTILHNPSARKTISVNAAVASNKNKIIKISDALKKYNAEADAQKAGSSSNEADRNTYTRPAIRFFEGQSMNGIWAVKSLGIDPSCGRELFVNPENGEVTYVWNADHQVIAGDTRPKLTGNFGFNVEMGGFFANMNLGFSYKGYVYNSTLINKVENANIEWNVDRRIFTDRWQRPGQKALFKDIADATFTKPTSRFVQENSQLTINTINVGYDFRDHAFLKKLNLQRLRASVYANSFATFSTVKIERGTSYPFARNFSIALSANF